MHLKRQCLNWDLKNPLKQILISLSSFFSFRKTSLKCSSNLIHYLWLYLKLCLLQFSTALSILAHKCLIFFPEINCCHKRKVLYHKRNYIHQNLRNPCTPSQDVFTSSCFLGVQIRNFFCISGLHIVFKTETRSKGYFFISRFYAWMILIFFNSNINTISRFRTYVNAIDSFMLFY